MPGWLESINTCIGLVSSAIGIVSAAFALLAWQKAKSIRGQQVEDERRRAEPIRLILVNETSAGQHVLGYRPRRDQATRAEILGILGMYSGEARFDSARLVPVLEGGDFDRMLQGKTSELHFRVSDADFERFVKRDQKL